MSNYDKYDVKTNNATKMFDFKLSKKLNKVHQIFMIYYIYKLEFHL